MGALTGIDRAKTVRRANALPIGEVYKSENDKLWKAWSGYECPTEFLGSHDTRTEAMAAVNRADREHRGVREFEGPWQMCGAGGSI